MTKTIIRIHTHPSRRCANCDHVDTSNEYQCLNLVSMVDDSPIPADFACGEHQTAEEFRLDLHLPSSPMLLPV